MLENIVPLEPLHFFDLEIDVSQKPTLLPDFLKCQIAKVYMWWENAGLHFRFEFDGPFDEPHPRGDCIELLIDTRDLKSSTITQFCHHFLILPEKVDGEIAKEVTRFRTEERHLLAHPDKIIVKSEKKRGRRLIEVFLSKELLHGYDPSKISRLGFNYRILEATGDWQVLSASWEDFPVDQHPILWATINLERE